MFELNLSNTKVFRKRQVYDFITFVAEVSGFADLFMIASTFFLGNFYQPQMLRSALLQHMKPMIVRRQKKKLSADLTTKIVISKEMLTLMMIEYTNRIKFNFNVWLTLFARYLPSVCRSNRTNQLLSLADQSLARIDRALDVKNLV